MERLSHNSVRTTAHTYSGSVMSHLSIGELRLLLSTVHAEGKNQKLGDILSILTTTGLRIGELSCLKCADIDFAHRRLVIPALNQRWVPFGPKVLTILQARCDQMHSSALVFDMHPNYLRHRLLLDLSPISAAHFGGRRLTPHLLRRSFGMAWMITGGSQISLMVTMGYKNHEASSVVRLLGREGMYAVAAKEQKRLEDALLGK